MAEQSILAADIGGTSSRFAHFRLRDGDISQLELVRSVWLSTKAAHSFAELLSQLAQSDLGLKLADATFASFAVAGPVERGVYCKPPLIEWDVDLSSPARMGLPRVGLINDFVAQAYACRSPLAKEARQILAGTLDADGVAAVIGAGTGLGKSVLVPISPGKYRALPSEGGHASFAPQTKSEFEFAQSIISATGAGYATWDDVVSGKGLVKLHFFLTGKQLSAAEVAATLVGESETLAWFSRFYARACRNFALEALAFGGVYVAGGVAMKNPQILSHREFARNFRDSRVYGELLGRIPLFLVSSEESGLWGAGLYGAQQLVV